VPITPEQCRINGSKSKGPATAYGKAVVSQNARKHGLLAEKPPLLQGEDLATFEGIMQSLIDEHQPQGALEHHTIQQIAMCLLRQHRLWQAEVAQANNAMLPPIESSATDEKYPSYREDEDRREKTPFHPDNLSLEKKLLRELVTRYPLEEFPTKYRSKYWDVEWEDWFNGLQELLTTITRRYPFKVLTGYPSSHMALVDQDRWSEQLQDWLNDLNKAKHPYGVLSTHLYWLKVSAMKPEDNKSKGLIAYRQEQHQELLDVCQGRLDEIATIEAEREAEQRRVEAQTVERQSLISSPITEQIGLLCRYESHINNQLLAALERLNTLQGTRKATAE
jgi:hypothetical protein